MLARVAAFRADLFGGSGNGGGDPDPVGVAIFSEDFSNGEDFTFISPVTVAGNLVGEMIIPGSGNRLAKNTFVPELPLAGDEEIGITARVQLPNSVIGSPTFSIRLTFATPSGSVVANGSTISLGSSYVGQFVDYATQVDVPSDATGILDMRLRVVQTTGNSDTQPLYVDDIELLSYVGNAANLDPIVSITSPADGAQFPAQTAVTVTVSASDPDGDIDTVELVVDGEPFGQDSSAPYEFLLENLPVGVRELEAIASDDQGAIASDTIDIGVAPTADLGVLTQAEDFDAQKANSTLGIFGTNPKKIGSIRAGDWVRFDLFDFEGGSDRMTIALSSANQGGTVEFWVDSLNGTKIGSASIGGTGGWNNFVEIPVDLDVTVSGPRDLFLVFTGGTQALMDVDWFTFFAASNLDLYGETFESPHGFSSMGSLSLNGNTVGVLTVPGGNGSGNVTAKDDLGGLSNAIDLQGATEVTVETDLQLPAAVQGYFRRMVLRFLDETGNGHVDVNADYLELTNQFVGNFQRYQKVIAVPAGVDRIGEVRIRIDQNVSGSPAQTVYVDNVEVIQN